MNVEEMKEYALRFAAVYAFLVMDITAKGHDPDAHNLCSAVIRLPDGRTEVLYSYSNPSALKKALVAEYEFVIGDVPVKIIDRGGMQDLHTEVRLINHVYYNYGLYAVGGTKNDGLIITFFSSRSVCSTCRSAIFKFMEKVAGKAGVMAMEFKVEHHGTVTESIYPIAKDPKSLDYAMAYQ